MNTGPQTKSKMAALTLGATIDSDSLSELTAALKPQWEKLTAPQQEEAKVLAASMMLGNQEAAEALRERIRVWFPMPILPLPPIFWENDAAPVTIASVAVGLIVIGIGIMLL